MSNTTFQRHDYDIDLKHGVGAHLITWVTGLMVFFITLMLAVNIALGAASKSWIGSLSGSMTVEIKPAPGANTETSAKALESAADKAAAIAKKDPAVSAVRILPRTEVAALIEPWLGQKLPADMPLPALLDIKTYDNVDTQPLQKSITAAVPGAIIDTHQDTLGDVKTLIGTVRGFAAVVTLAIVLLAVVSISGIVRAKFAIHKGETEILHLLGASNEYIARQFRHHALQGTLKGTAAGIAATFIVILAVGFVARSVSAAVLPPVYIHPLAWAGLVVAPLVGGVVIAHVTAQVTALRALARLN